MKKIVIELTAQELETNLNLLATHPWNQVNSLIQNMSTQATQQAMSGQGGPIAPNHDSPAHQLPSHPLGAADGAGFVQPD